MMPVHDLAFPVYPAKAGTYLTMGTGLSRCDRNGRSFRYRQDPTARCSAVL